MIKYAHITWLYGLILVPIIILLYLFMRAWRRRGLGLTLRVLAEFEEKVRAPVSGTTKIVSRRQALRESRVTLPRREVEDSRPPRRDRAQRPGLRPLQAPRATSG